MKKYLLAASALALGMSLASGALADQSADGNDGNIASAVGNSTNDGDDDNNVLSNNDVDVNSGNSDDDNNGDNRNNIVDSGNTTVDVDVDVEVDIDNSVNDSVVANQSLSATVTDTRVTFDDAQLQLNLGNDGDQDFNTGQISLDGDSFRGFTGIATIAMDTSLGSVNQAATQVAAAADVTFD